MSTAQTPTSGPRTRYREGPSIGTQIIGLGAACGFYYLFFTFLLARWIPVLARIQEKEELARPTHQWLLVLGQLNEQFSGGLLYGWMALLLLTNIGLRFAGQNRWWVGLHWGFLVAVVLVAPAVAVGMVLFFVSQIRYLSSFGA